MGEKKGIGFLSLLGLIFLVLKLLNIIAWSWFWVLSPFLLNIIFFIIQVIFLSIYYYFNEWEWEIILFLFL